MRTMTERLRNYMASDDLANAGCQHREMIHEVTPSAKGCEDCLKTGDRWVHLRMCMTCGYAGCCESSRNKHASKHARATGHPLVTSLEFGEEWAYCYEDEEIVFPE